MLRAVCGGVHDILKQMMTRDSANTQTCPFRVWGSLGFLTLLALMLVNVWRCKGDFSPAEYGGAMSAYLLAWGGAIFAKGKVNQ